ncbi:MAG: branched-chain amino acid ABC transporter permease [Desulfobacterales bacterium]|nr:branched-chain amino acid ABC transporter permease [Desulfobacterales bacterium]
MRIEIRQELIIYVATYLVLLLLPVFLHKDAYIIGILITCMVWGAVASVWNFTMGYAGIFTFGQFGFFVVAAYTSGMVTKYLGISPWLGILIGGLMAALVGVLIGLPCMKLKGAYIALITFALHLVVAPMIKVADPLGTGGSTGLMSIPKLSLGAYTFSRTDLIPWYYTALAISFLVLLVVYKTIFSSIGLGFIGLRDSEDFAKTLGINEYKYKLMVFGLSAFLTGIMGGFYAHYAGIISPRLLGLDIFLLVMLMMIIGGMGIFPGAFLGGFIILFLNEFLRPLEAYRFLIFGAIVVVAIKAMPEGILGNLNFFKKRLGKRLQSKPAEVKSTTGQNI